MKILIKKIIIFILIQLLLCSCNSPWNDPYPSTNATADIFYTSFTEQPKTLDPARSYSANESVFTAQIYEPPIQYHYLKEPCTLVPLTAVAMPTPFYTDKNGKQVPANSPDIAFSVYDIKIKPGIFYQPHPALAKDNKGKLLYSHLSEADLNDVYNLNDFPHQGTRELTAEDYVYQIKRLAGPKTESPILGVMEEYILGLKEYAVNLQKIYDVKEKEHGYHHFFDLRLYNFPGVKILDRYTYRIFLKGQYPQFIYWLAMPFFAPIPWEADLFYSQPGMDEKNITLDWFPIGTGPYLLQENNPNRQMVLSKNPNFHGETYPTEGNPEDVSQGLLLNAGKNLPFTEKFVFTLEKESIPRWTKFLQGYYDQSGISSDNFDQAIAMDREGRPFLTPYLQSKKLRLQTSVSPAIHYIGFNMLDDVVGGYSERARKLRQAISIAVDYEEFINIFLNGRGISATGPLPPGIFGFLPGKNGMNPFIYDWVDNHPQRKSLEYAQKLLAEAGYPKGRDEKTGNPLILNLDVTSGGGPDENSQFDWYRKQFAKLGIELQIQATQYNRFQEKVRTGATQIFIWGWIADYPDPENFLFLLYGPNAKVKLGGENASNYKNLKFDAMFKQMKILPNGPERQKIIDAMNHIVQEDAPWIWGYHPENFVLTQQWVSPIKSSQITNNTLKYIALDPKLRAITQKKWNRPILWPVAFLILLLLGVAIPAFVKYRQMEWQTRRKQLDV